MEQWKNLTIPNYEHFMISNMGRVYNNKRQTYIAIGDNGRGYKNCKIKSQGKTLTLYIHRLVAEAFLPDWNPDLQVNHIDKNKANNCIDNLEMVTDSHNKKHSSEEYLRGHLKAQGKILQIYDTQGNLLEEHLGMTDYCRCHNLDARTVQRMCVGKGRCKTYKGLIFKYKER